MDDLIRRQDVLMLAKDIVVHTPNGEYRHRCIDQHEVWELPSAQRWIPVSDRLPEKSGTVIVTVVMSKFNKPFVETLYYDADTKGGKEFFCGWVTAWMPLPEPYRKADMRGE